MMGFYEDEIEARTRALASERDALRAKNAELVTALEEARNLIRNLGGQHGELFARIDAALAAGHKQGSRE